MFKSDDKHCVRNYRPIPLLCIVSKVLERIVYDNMIDFVRSQVSTCLFGFLKGHSIQQLLNIFFNSVINSSSQSDVAYLYIDFRKAFDSVWLIMNFCTSSGTLAFTDSLWKWLRAYLIDRLQYVRVGQSFSGTLPVISGVPQGSILGPFLFLIFINNYISSMIWLFADDAKCLMPISSMADCLCRQSDLNCLADWSSTWNQVHSCSFQ